MVPNLAAQLSLPPSCGWHYPHWHDLDLCTRHPCSPQRRLSAVQELIGHSRWDMTLEIYTASVPEVLRDPADSLDALSDQEPTAQSTATKRLPDASKRPSRSWSGSSSMWLVPKQGLEP